MAVFKFKSEFGFEFLELPALKTGGRSQHIPEIEKVHRGHGLHDIHLVHQYPQDGDTTAEPVNNGL